jgi:uncharacterized membrane protein
LKIKFTHPTAHYQAGLVYEMPDKQAQEYLDADIAVIVEDVELVNATAHGDKEPVFIESVKQKKVKHGNG